MTNPLKDLTIELVKAEQKIVQLELRVEELLRYNTEEVERRRKAQAEVKRLQALINKLEIKE